MCDVCAFVHYQNPKIVVGAIPVHGEQILLCKRAIEPCYGKWTLPAGFMENAETTAQGAARETMEEAGAHIELAPLFTLMSVPHVSQVHMYYRAQLSGGFKAGDESLEVRLFREEDIPWADIAFRTVTVTLQKFFEDRQKESFGFHCIDLFDDMA